MSVEEAAASAVSRDLRTKGYKVESLPREVDLGPMFVAEGEGQRAVFLVEGALAGRVQARAATARRLRRARELATKLDADLCIANVRFDPEAQAPPRIAYRKVI